MTIAQKINGGKPSRFPRYSPDGYLLAHLAIGLYFVDPQFQYLSLPCGDRGAYASRDMALAQSHAARYSGSLCVALCNCCFNGIHDFLQTIFLCHNLFHREGETMVFFFRLAGSDIDHSSYVRILGYSIPARCSETPYHTLCNHIFDSGGAFRRTHPSLGHRIGRKKPLASPHRHSAPRRRLQCCSPMSQWHGSFLIFPQQLPLPSWTAAFLKPRYT